MARARNDSKGEEQSQEQQGISKVMKWQKWSIYIKSEAEDNKMAMISRISTVK
jgi:hypothetical protein